MGAGDVRPTITEIALSHVERAVSKELTQAFDLSASPWELGCKKMPKLVGREWAVQSRLPTEHFQLFIDPRCLGIAHRNLLTRYPDVFPPEARQFLQPDAGIDEEQDNGPPSFWLRLVGAGT